MALPGKDREQALSFWLGSFFAGTHQSAHPAPGFQWDVIGRLLFFSMLSLLNWIYCLLKFRS